MSTAENYKHKIAVIGGGVSGCAAVRRLMELDDNSCFQITLFDWGRSIGGRSSHRYRPEASTSEPEKTLTLHFDHGAQFFHATDQDFLDSVADAIEKWPKSSERLGWLDSRTGKFESSVSVAKAGPNEEGFFGVCNSKLDSCRYVGIGGMDAVAKELLGGATAIANDGRLCVHEKTRVARCQRVNSTWKLYGDGLGHEDANVQALQDSNEMDLGTFDELIITDHMALAMPAWHPCHIGGLDEHVPELISQVRTALGWDEKAQRFRLIMPLFTCMLALEGSLSLEFDAATVQGSDILQFLCCQESRPHKSDEETKHLERWLLVSTVDFAELCLEKEGMSKPSEKTRASSQQTNSQYIPQTNEYLSGDPAEQMVQAFLGAVECGQTNSNPKVVFRKAQRWGAAFTDGATYDENRHLEQMMKTHEEAKSVTVCGDFVHEIMQHSHETRPKSLSIENAALSGRAAASRVASRLKRGDN